MNRKKILGVNGNFFETSGKGIIYESGGDILLSRLFTI